MVAATVAKQEESGAKAARVLAVMSDKRYERLPDGPTVKASGMLDFAASEIKRWARSSRAQRSNGNSQARRACT